MSDIVNPGNQNGPLLNTCNDIGLQGDMNNDIIPKICNTEDSLNRVITNQNLDWLSENCDDNYLGRQCNCDPMQSGQIINDLQNPTREYVYRYTKAKRACDEAVRDLFTGIIVIDTLGKSHPVPIIWGTQERAVAVILQNNVRKDNSLVTDRPKVPLLAINDTTFEMNRSRYVYHKAISYLNNRPDKKPSFTVNEKYERDTVFGVAVGMPVKIGYTLYAWTLYEEDMNQIVEQIQLKFSPIAYISIKGVVWESILSLESVTNNIEAEPGEKKRVVKYQFNLMAETYIPQPIIRKKAVLDMKTNIIDENTKNIYNKIEVAVKEFEEKIIKI
jgi:hypothetical protein